MSDAVERAVEIIPDLLDRIEALEHRANAWRDHYMKTARHFEELRAGIEWLLPVYAEPYWKGAADGWDACLAEIRQCDPDYTDECDSCTFRDDVLADLDVNPYRGGHR